MPKHMKKLPSPKVIRKSCVAKSTAKKPSMYPKAPEEEYANLSPNSQARIRAEGQKVQNYLVEEAKRAEAVAKVKLLGQQPGSSTQHTGSPKKKRKNNKGHDVSPYASSPEDAWLSPSKCDGSIKPKRMLAYSPNTKSETNY